MQSAAVAHPKQNAVLLIKRRNTILVVEDNKLVLDATLELLSGAGYNVLGAPNAETALRLFAAGSEEIDLLLCDAVLPDQNGAILAQSLRRLSPGLKVLLVSGYPASILSGIKAEAELPFLSKPFSAKRLLSEIEVAFKLQDS